MRERAEGGEGEAKKNERESGCRRNQHSERVKKKRDRGAWGRNQHRERVKKKPAQRAREKEQGERLASVNQ